MYVLCACEEEMVLTYFGAGRLSRLKCLLTPIAGDVKPKYILTVDHSIARDDSIYDRHLWK